MKTMLIAALMCAMCAPAYAGSLQDKTCIVNADRYLPSQNALSFTTHSVRPISAHEAAQKIADKFRDANNAAQQINAEFVSFSAASLDVIRHLDAGGSYAEAQMALTNALQKRLSGASDVQSTVWTLSGSTTFDFTCAWVQFPTKARFYVSPNGVMR